MIRLNADYLLRGRPASIATICLSVEQWGSSTLHAAGSFADNKTRAIGPDSLTFAHEPLDKMSPVHGDCYMITSLFCLMVCLFVDTVFERRC